MIFGGCLPFDWSLSQKADAGGKKRVPTKKPFSFFFQERFQKWPIFRFARCAFAAFC